MLSQNIPWKDNDLVTNDHLKHVFTNLAGFRGSYLI